jgi:hypothetical protein
MIHPILSLLISRPELVIDHMAGYAALVQEESSGAARALARQAIAWGIALLGLIVFLILAGVALMLGAMRGEFHWALVLTPGAALLMALLAGAVARRQVPAGRFLQLKAQLHADVLALRVAEAAS